MKKSALIAYTLAAITVGGLIGGGVTAWALGQAARVGYGPYQLGIYFESENKAFVQVYNPKRVLKVTQEGTHRVAITLE